MIHLLFQTTYIKLFSYQSTTSKKKGLSLEEKRTKLLELFLEKKEFFQLKELEKLGPKEKGIVSQSVKEVLQQLVDDDLVHAEKVGTLMLYWAFPSEAILTRKKRLEKLEKTIAGLDAAIESAHEKKRKSHEGKEESEERTNLIEKMKSLEKREAELSKEIDSLKDCDPDYLEKLKEETEMSKTAVNRWTDNVFAVKNWCKARFGFEEEVLNKQFDIPPDLDYVE